MDGLLSVDGCLLRPGNTGHRGRGIHLVNQIANDGLTGLNCAGGGVIEVDRLGRLDYNHRR